MTLTWDKVLSNCQSATSSANPIRTHPGVKSGLRGHKPSTKCADHAVSFPISVSPQKMCNGYPLHMSQQLVHIPRHINPVNTLPEFSVSTLLSYLWLDLPRSILISKFSTKCLHVSLSRLQQHSKLEEKKVRYVFSRQKVPKKK